MGPEEKVFRSSGCENKPTGHEKKAWNEFSGSFAISLLTTKVPDTDLHKAKNAWDQTVPREHSRCTVNAVSLPPPSW